MVKEGPGVAENFMEDDNPKQGKAYSLLVSSIIVFISPNGIF